MGVLNSLDDPFSDTKGKSGSKVFSNISKYLVPFDYEKTETKSGIKGDSFDFVIWVGTATAEILEKPDSQTVKARLAYAVKLMFKKLPK